MSTFAQPRPISVDDDVAAFSCGKQSLDNWLNLRAIKNEKDGNSRTFVSIERESGLIAGYYCLSSHAVTHEQASTSLRRNSPDPIPVILIGRLAVDARFAGQGVGYSLLRDAFAKAIEAADIVGSRAVLVDALDDEAVGFYRKFGFRLMPQSARALYVTLADARATLASVAN